MKKRGTAEEGKEGNTARRGRRGKASNDDTNNRTANGGKNAPVANEAEMRAQSSVRRDSSGRNASKGRGDGRNSAKSGKRVQLESAEHQKNQHKKEHSVVPPAMPQLRRPSRPSPDIDRYWTEIIARGATAVKHSDISKWKGTWKAAAAGAEGDRFGLLRVYMQLPDISTFYPGAECILNVLSLVLDEVSASADGINKNSSKKKADDAARFKQKKQVELLQTVCNVMCKRLKPHLDASMCTMTLDDIDIAKKYRDATLRAYADGGNAELMAHIASLMQASAEVAKCEEALKQNIKYRSPSLSTPTDERSVTVWNAWQNCPSVQWLLAGEWLDAPALRSLYNDSQEYAETMLRIWVLLTFYWGAGALWPKCLHKQKTSADAKLCGEPLLTKCSRAVSCRSQKCNNAAQWTCHRSNHHAICSTCLSKHQAKLCGPCGSDASTDVYDALVDCETVRSDGAVYIVSGVQSRKPPLQAPSWRTTYRLNCSALVAIVRLHACGESISDKSIIWAEIVPMSARDGAGDDWKQREKQRMAIRVLTRSDCEGLPEESECPLEAGSHLAVIDLRVFVPEVVSILSTFAKQSFAAELSQMPFTDSLIGKHVDHYEFIFSRFLKKYRKVHCVVKEAILNSNLPVVHRMSTKDKEAIANAICEIPAVQSLSGTQLDAFASALLCSVHCTQGPPGTGKSYLGVCLVLAMTIIRHYAQQGGCCLGPIVVLSYKNHALDEFLCDVVDDFKTTWSRELRRGQMIRCGHPEHESLQIFSERKQALETETGRVLTRYICALRLARDAAYDFWDCAHSLETISLPWIPRELYASATFEGMKVNYAAAAVLRALEILNIFSDKMERIVEESIVSNSVMELLLDKCLSNKVYSVSQDFNAIDARKWLVAIVRGAEHWKSQLDPTEHLVFLLGQYLAGAKPPPRCVAVMPNGKQCLQCAPQIERGDNSAIITEYCRKFHACRISSCSKMRNVGVSDFCIEHHCEYHQCGDAKHNGSQFCMKHTCLICVMCNIKPRSTQPNACPAHTCSQDACDRMIVLPHAFCEFHCCTVCLRLGHAQVQSNIGGNLCILHKCFAAGCQSERSNGKDSCEFHTCVDCGNCIDKACPDSHLCSSHRCAANHCKRRHTSHSLFCIIHSCKVCLNHQEFGDIASDLPPRNACAKHPLCNHMLRNGTLCNEVAVPPGIYCAKHCNNDHGNNETGEPEEAEIEIEFQCSGKKKKGGRCKAKMCLPPSKGKWYCNAHMMQNNEDGSSSDDEVEGDNGVNDIPLDEDLSRLSTLKPSDFPASRNYIVPSEEHRKKACASSGCSYFVYSNDENDQWHCAFHRVSIAALEISTDIEWSPPAEVLGETAKIFMDKSGIDEPLRSKRIARGESQREGDVDDAVVLLSEGHIDDVSAFDIPMDERDDNVVPDDTATAQSNDENEGDESDNLQHLRDIADVDCANEDDDTCEDDLCRSVDGSIDRYYIRYPWKQGQKLLAYDYRTELAAWSWDVPLKERLPTVAKLLRFVAVWINETKHLAYPHVDAARQDHSESRSVAFKQALIVGATVVGASRRLEAIRAAEPFAIVVEEACEVMEPALMSVLAVKSLHKLELVGDHRQLPAFVQQCWYNLELTHSTIKTSLFERLVTGSQARSQHHRNAVRDDAAVPLPCTILDEQRRMRKEIADITRFEYSDLVEIRDHSSVHSQLVGDRYILSLGRAERDEFIDFRRNFWERAGRCVPGALTNVFFWDIPGNAESRPVAGLSACNQTEAAAAANLCKWFMNCGVPGSCITVITPYKGQKTLLIKCLRQVNCIPPPNKTSERAKGAQVNVLLASTVDRYQGDENDIVILSLVRVYPGNRFIGLVNRFIVGTSRARLGFFILGSKRAVAGTPHWQRLLENLEKPLIDVVSTVEYAPVRLGEAFPLCCPTHRPSNFTGHAGNSWPVNNLSAWHTNVCCKPCRYVLPLCGHTCGQPCHILEPNSHNSKCTEKVPRPCGIHANQRLTCHRITEKHPNVPINTILKRYECDIEVEVFRPECHHTFSLSCHDKKLFEAGTKPLPPCKFPMTNFTLSCGHLIESLKCSTWQKYMKTPPACKVKVSVFLNCGHAVQILCEEYRKQHIFLECKAAVTYRRPRCAHAISTLCCNYTMLQQAWREHNGISAEESNAGTVVNSGVLYGPAEEDLLPSLNLRPCSELVTFRRRCGHECKNVMCSKAFSYASDDGELAKCNELVSISCPFCSSNIKVPCYAADFFRVFVPFGNNFHVFRNAEDRVVIAEELLTGDLEKLPKFAVSILQSTCTDSVLVKRSCPSHHFEQIPCRNLISIMLKKVSLPKCKALVTKNLACSHSIVVKCCERDRTLACMAPVLKDYVYSCGLHTTPAGYCSKLQSLIRDNPPCPEKTLCRVYRCGHTIEAQCKDKRSIEENDIGEQLMDYLHSNTKQKIVISGRHYCSNNDYNILCKELVTYRNSCGHDICDVPCCDAFSWALDDSADNATLPECKETVPYVHPVCNHTINVSCWLRSHASNNWKPWEHCMRPNMEKVTHKLDDENGSPVFRDVIHHPFDSPAPYEHSSKLVCSEKVEVVRLCGHEQVMSCSEVFNTISLCKSMVEMKCNNGHVRLEECHEALRQYESGDYKLCRVATRRLCEICNVNTVDVECFRANAKCQTEVVAEKECGHTVKWTCGKDDDPRITNKPCLYCNVNNWDIAINETIKKEAFCKMIDKLQQNVENFFRNSFTESRVIQLWSDVKLKFESHKNARLNMMKVYKDQLHEGKIDTNVIPPPPQIGDSDDIAAYTLVFTSADMSNVDTAKKACDMKQTTYGRGVELCDLSAENIRRLCVPVDGKATLVVCATYRQHMLRSCPPFARQIGSKGSQKANQRMSSFQSRAYDCVEMVLDGAVAAANNDTDDENDDVLDAPITCPVLYWTPGIALGLGIVEVKIAEHCDLCLEYCKREDGYTCGKGHFICWECLKRYGESAASDDAMPQSVDRDGNLKCLSCDDLYTISKLAQIAPPEVTDILTTVRTKVVTRINVSAALEAERIKLKNEFERIQAIEDADERNANILRCNIVDNILTLRCPRTNCRQAFVDFDGCFALTCSNNNCQAGFCAWCLKDCGDDAHSHVRNCKDNKNNKSVHGSLDMFHDHHRQRKQKLIESRLDDVNERVAYFTYNLLCADIVGTNINLRARHCADRRISTTHDTLVPWSMPPAEEYKGMRRYTIHRRDVLHVVTRETYEYNMCTGHFSRLLPQYLSNITKIDVIDYDQTCHVRKRYEDTKKRFAAEGHSTEETWVFHGTHDFNIGKILMAGFAVGGEDPNVPVLNGRAYGPGVYTATSPVTPMGYGNNRVILAKGLKGSSTSHRCPIKDFVIFSKGDQLLPCYIVHCDDNRNSRY